MIPQINNMMDIKKIKLMPNIIHLGIGSPQINLLLQDNPILNKSSKINIIIVKKFLK